ncbi:hypothetical protein NYA30BAC_02226 [Halomonas sp. NYA30]
MLPGITAFSVQFPGYSMRLKAGVPAHGVRGKRQWQFVCPLR